MTGPFQIRHQGRQLRPEQAALRNASGQRRRMRLPTTRTPMGMALVFFDRRGQRLQINLLHDTRRLFGLFQQVATIRTVRQAMHEGGRHLLGREGSTEVRRVAWLAAPGTLGGTRNGGGFGRLDDIRGRRFGGRGRILAGLGQLFLQLTDQLLGGTLLLFQLLQARLQLLIVTLQLRTLGTGRSSWSSHDLDSMLDHLIDKMPVNRYSLLFCRSWMSWHIMRTRCSCSG